MDPQFDDRSDCGQRERRVPNCRLLSMLRQTQSGFCVGIGAIATVLTLGLALVSVFGCGRSDAIDGFIIGASMYPTLKGARFDVRCEDCGFEFETDATKLPKNRRFVCPNCGYGDILTAGLKELPSQSIRIEKASGSLGRWQLVCFKDRKTGKIVVKRIVGLPGESVSLVDGKIQVNGTTLATPDVIPKIPVFDSKYQSNAAPSRINPGNKKDSAWKLEGSDWVCSKVKSEGASVLRANDLDWLNYRHRRCYANFYSEPWLRLPQDNLGFNQTISRKLNDVRELEVEVKLGLLECEKFALQIGPLTLLGRRLTGPKPESSEQQSGRWAEVEIRVARSGPHSELENYDLQSGELVATRKLKMSAKNAIRFSNLGNEFRLSWDEQDELLLTIEQLQSLGGPQGVQTLFARELPVARVACVTGEMQLKELLIRRAIYWFDSSRDDESGPRLFRLKEDEFFVVGDNPAVSKDSRQFSPTGIRRDEIIGVVQQD